MGGIQLTLSGLLRKVIRLVGAVNPLLLLLSSNSNEKIQACSVSSFKRSQKPILQILYNMASEEDGADALMSEGNAVPSIIAVMYTKANEVLLYALLTVSALFKKGNPIRSETAQRDTSRLWCPQ